MTISRMQEPRQLYGLGSLVKKITKPIKKIVKSPIGKAALGAAAYIYGVNRFGIPGSFYGRQREQGIGDFLLLKETFIRSKNRSGEGIHKGGGILRDY